MNITESIEFIKDRDYELGNSISDELERQQNTIELIASENIVSPVVLAAMGSILTNKYAEGYSGHRYYGGCEFIDKIENLAIDRACKLFNCKFANVQPHSGANANLAVFFAFLNPGDTVLSMNLSNGGHISHGSPVNISGKWFNVVSYGTDSTGYINYYDVRKLALENHPKLIIAGASAYPREIDFEKFRSIADEVNAILMVDMAHIAGLVATGLHKSPIPYADVITSTTHKTLRGPRGGLILWNDEKFTKKINSAIFPGTQGGPLEHIIAGKAACFGEALTDEFKEYQQNVVKNARALANGLRSNNIKLVSGGTDNHLMLVDLSETEITGKELEHKLDSVGITLNKNTIPNERRSPFITSGVRIGTPAVTTRGFDENDMYDIAKCISLIINDYDLNAKIVREKVKSICDKYRIY